ncbi:uncharacterized protein LOC143683145 [Tamandua tetradactyla]|uniref:uncharacterized protein LOC143683145 n=1 Tax=Tamandua tetradactyla TaxID=48850 RepID=UPI004053B1BB
MASDCGAGRVGNTTGYKEEQWQERRQHTKCKLTMTHFQPQTQALGVWHLHEKHLRAFPDSFPGQCHPGKAWDSSWPHPLTQRRNLRSRRWEVRDPVALLILGPRRDLGWEYWRADPSSPAQTWPGSRDTSKAHRIAGKKRRQERN